MKRLSSLALALALCAPALGCRTTHLGPNTGLAYRDALAAQRDSEAKPPTPLDAADARAVLEVHRAGATGDKGRAGARGATSSSSSSHSSSPSDLGSSSGSFGPSGRQIRLDAK